MASRYSNNNNIHNNNSIDEEDYSESQTTMNPEQFEDEPGNQNYNNHNNNNNHSNIVYPSNDPYDQRYQINDDDDDDVVVEDDTTTVNTPYASNRSTNYDTPSDDPYGRSSNTTTTAPSPSRQYHNNNNHHYNNNENENDEEYDSYPPPSSSMEEQAPPPPRQHKYSSANLREQGKWKKWCQILLLFLIFLAIAIVIRMLFNHLFFGDTSDNAPPETVSRDENGTFAKDKQEIDSACGRTTLAMDEGTLCKEACIPEFFHCCDPFDEFVLYNYTIPVQNTTNTTNTTDDLGRKPDLPERKNLTFLEGYELPEETCTFDTNVRGCMAYAKCHALAGQADPAPIKLPEMCSMDQLKENPEDCAEECGILKCCYSTKSDNCMAEKFDLCMDYAPCQNLRMLDAPTGVLETAPRTLDYDCYNQEQQCTETCEQARCCSDLEDYSCFQYNFLSCITYAPCSNVTEVNITIPAQFIHVPQPSIDLVYACDTDAPIIEPTDRTCEQICNDAACCWSTSASDNCFHMDPLGCLAYEAQCQSLLSQS